MFQYVNYLQAKSAGAAFLHLTGEQASDGTVRYYAKIALVEAGGAVREIVRGKHMTFDEVKKRAEAEAKKRGIAFIVSELSPLTLATVTAAIP
jgi:hypothetical protein